MRGGGGRWWIPDKFYQTEVMTTGNVLRDAAPRKISLTLDFFKRGQGEESWPHPK